MKLLLLSIWSIVTLAYCVPPQSTSYYQPPSYYQYPMHISPELAASFGEVREEHFHLGLDFRTNGRVNIPVYAVADGYISRIQVSEYGYGKVVFVNHPNGTTSLYAHLNRLNDEVEQYLRAKQYRSKSWQQDIALPAGRFQVKKDALIAYSGNTGNTEGPHLHFEIRDTKTNNSLNPLIKAFKISDDIPPTIKNVYWYDRRSSIYNNEGKALFSVAEESGNEVIYKVSSAMVSLGVETLDKLANTRFNLGIYKARLYMDNVLKHTFSLDQINEQRSRYVNACIDYEKMLWSGKRIQYLFTLPGNHLSAYRSMPAQGILDLSDSKTHSIVIAVEDAFGNATKVRFKLQLASVVNVLQISSLPAIDVLPNIATILHTKHAKISFSRFAFYDKVPFLLKEVSAVNAGAASPLIRLHNGTVPVHDDYEIGIQTTLAANDTLRRHTVMMLNSIKGRHVLRGIWKGNTMFGRFTELGTVQLITDVTVPEITLQSPGNLDRSDDDAVLRLSCRDNLGLLTFKAELDGQWILFEKKGSIFTYRPDAYCKAGKRKLKITVCDVAGNSTVKTFVLNIS